jgi:hypothetical protein
MPDSPLDPFNPQGPINFPGDPVPLPMEDALGRERGRIADELSSSAAAKANPDIRDMTREQLMNERKISAEKKRQLALETAKQKAIQKTNLALEQAEKGRIQEMRRLARQTGNFDPEKGFIITDSQGNVQFLSEQQFREGIKRGDTATKRKVEQLSRNITTDLLSGPTAPTQAKEFRVGELIQNLMSGNFGGALAELMQPIGKEGGSIERAVEKANQQRAMPGKMNTLKGGLKGLGLSLLRPGVALGAIAAADQIKDMAQGQVRLGQITGGGLREGLAATGEGIRLAGNPFDMLDRRTAMEIVRGVRSKGFRGEMARALEDSVGKVFKDLGTD